MDWINYYRLLLFFIPKYTWTDVFLEFLSSKSIAFIFKLLFRYIILRSRHSFVFICISKYCSRNNKNDIYFLVYNVSMSLLYVNSIFLDFFFIICKINRNHRTFWISFPRFFKLTVKRYWMFYRFLSCFLQLLRYNNVYNKLSFKNLQNRHEHFT